MKKKLEELDGKFIEDCSLEELAQSMFEVNGEGRKAMELMQKLLTDREKSISLIVLLGMVGRLTCQGDPIVTMMFEQSIGPGYSAFLDKLREKLRPIIEEACEAVSKERGEATNG